MHKLQNIYPVYMNSLHVSNGSEGCCQQASLWKTQALRSNSMCAMVKFSHSKKAYFQTSVEGSTGISTSASVDQHMPLKYLQDTRHIYSSTKVDGVRRESAKSHQTQIWARETQKEHTRNSKVFMLK